MEKTVRTVEGIVLRSFRDASGDGLPKIWWDPDSHRPVSLCATLSIIQSPPFLKSERLDFKGKSLRIQWCFKALFVIGFIKDKVLCSSKYFIRVPGSQASDRGELSGFLAKQSMKRTTTGILLIFLFSETVCDFFNWVNLSEILVDEISYLWLIVGTLSKIKNVKQRAASLGLFFSY